MKKIVIIFIITFLYGALDVSAQKYLTTSCEKVILYRTPYPDTNYKAILYTLIKYYKQFVPITCEVDCIFVDAEDSIFFDKKEYDKMKFDKFMVFANKKVSSLPNWNLNGFNKFKKSKTDSLKYDFNNDIDSADILISFKKNKVKNNKFNVVKNLCQVYEINNAFGILSYELIGNESSSVIKLCLTSYIKVKEMGMITMVFAIYNNKEDLIWLKDTSKSWSKAILDANK